MPLAQLLAIFSPGSLSCPKWSCCEKRLPQPGHRTPFSTTLPSAADRLDKWATTCWIEPNQVKHRGKKTLSSQLLFCPVNILHDTAATSPIPPNSLTAWKGLSERCCGWKFTGMSVLAAASGKVTQRCGQCNHTYSLRPSLPWASRNKHVGMCASLQATCIFFNFNSNKKAKKKCIKHLCKDTPRKILQPVFARRTIQGHYRVRNGNTVQI